MSIWAGVKAGAKLVFSGGDVIKSIENIASEWIETDLESAEAKVVMIKALDPNGKMRRDLGKRVTFLYTVYLLTTLALVACEFFGYGDAARVVVATDKLKEMFTPITTMFGLILGASFGVNYANVKQDK